MNKLPTSDITTVDEGGGPDWPPLSIAEHVGLTVKHGLDGPVAVYMFQLAPHLQARGAVSNLVRHSFLDSTAFRGQLALPIGNRDYRLPEVVVLHVGFAAVLIELSGLGRLRPGSIVLTVRSNHVISSRYYHEFVCDTFIYMVLLNVDFPSGSSDIVIHSTLPFHDADRLQS